MKKLLLLLALLATPAFGETYQSPTFDHITTNSDTSAGPISGMSVTASAQTKTLSTWLPLFAQKANNLSDLASASTARTNLGLGTPLAVGIGGTGCAVASGTCLDNITAFASTGIMSRTGVGTYTFSTQSALLDAIGSTRGSVLYRGAAGWAALPPGSATNVLSSGGAGADPAWTAAGSGTVTSVTCGAGLVGGPITSSGTCAVGVVIPQGRLTLATGVPVMRASQAGKMTVYYTPSVGNLVPLYDGTNLNATAFAEVSQATTDTTKSPAAVVPNAIYDIYCWVDAGTNRCTRSDYWKKATTVTITIASPAVVTWNSNGLLDGQPIVFTTTGTLPTGISAGITYFVKSPTTNTFNIATTVGGTAINTTGSQSGTQTGTAADNLGTVARASGGNAEQQFVSGIGLNKNAITNGPAAARGTFVGTIASNSAGTIDFIFGAASSGGTAAVFNLWNAYNRVPTSTTVTDTQATYNYASPTIRQAGGSAGNQVSFVLGSQIEAVDYSYTCALGTAISATSRQQCGVGFDQTSFFTKQPLYFREDGSSAARQIAASQAGAWLAPIGTHILSANEADPDSTTGAFNVFSLNSLDAKVWN